MRRSSTLLLFAVAAFAGCSNGSSTPVAGIIAPRGASPTPSPVSSATAAPSATPVPSATPSAPATTSSTCTAPTTQSIGAMGGTISANAASGTISEMIPANALTASTTVTFCYVPSSGLPAPLLRAPRQDKFGRRSPMFTQGAGNTYVAAFTTTFGGSPLASAASETATGAVPSSVAAGTALNIAMYNGTTWVDIGTATVNATGNYLSSAPTPTLPGVTAGGTYLVYIPAAGTNTSQVNYGFALAGDDDTATSMNGLQFVQIEDPSGNALPNPTSTFFPVDGTDLDGQSLTPDAQQGATVDGGSNVYFFSGIPQHSFNLSSAVINVSTYGGDGDSIVSLPNGDEAVVTADGGPLAVISNILAGNPMVADTVMTGGGGAERDGLVISTDGKTMLARESSSLDIYTVTPTAAHAGSTGTGTTSYNFALTTTLTSAAGGLPVAAEEDGRDDMAISPVDGSRAVIAGYDSGTDGPSVALLTGLNTATPTVSILHPQFAARKHSFGQVTRHPEAMPHRAPLAVTPTAGTTIYAVTISPNGKYAYISTDAGVVTFSGVDTGTLAQVGSVYAPNLPVTNSSLGSTCPAIAARSIGILPDGKYFVEDVDCGIAAGSTDATQGTGVLVTVPIGSGGVLGAPVGQYNNVVTPNNDQIIFH